MQARIQQGKNTITLSQEEYMRLKKQAHAYKTLASKIFELRLSDPIDEVVADFRNADLYEEGFLKDLDEGLRKSSYAKKYANKTSSKRS